MMKNCFVTDQLLNPLVLQEEWRRLIEVRDASLLRKCGASVYFAGAMRDYSQDGQLTSMQLECYEVMAVNALQGIVEEAKERFSVEECFIAHRYGEVFPAETIVYVWVLSAHRKAAFDAAAFIMDYLKIRAPFWKKEISKTQEKWVEFKESDAKSADKW